MDTWECCDLGEVQEFLQMCIKRKGNKIYLDQAVYLEKVLELLEAASVIVSSDR